MTFDELIHSFYALSVFSVASEETVSNQGAYFSVKPAASGSTGIMMSTLWNQSGIARVGDNTTIAYNEYIKVVPQDIYERDEEKNKITVNKDYKDVIEINVKKLKKNIYDQYLGK